MLAAALIDTDALGKIILASLLGGVGVVVAFGFLLLGLSKANTAEGRPGEQAGFYLLSVVCGVFCLAAVAVGIYAIAKKPSSAAPKPA
jgi:NADH:ubiquinone oxidoreductase subunit 6 (subunit J)